MKKEEKITSIKGISLKTISILVSTFTIVITALLITCVSFLNSKNHEVTRTTQEYMEWKNVASNVESASDYLTSEVRSFVILGEKKHMDNYFEESNVTKRREHALEILRENLEDSSVYTYVTTATNESMDLMNQEYYAMRLVCDVKSIDYSSYPAISNVQITTEDQALTIEARLDKSKNLVFGNTYENKKKIISININRAIETLDKQMKEHVFKASDDMKKLLLYQQLLIVMNILLLISLVFVMFFNFIRPLRKAVVAINDDDQISSHGVKEFAVVAEAYNKTHVQNRNVKERLVYEAEHDKLTHLYNRTGYDSIYNRLNLENCVYILVDGDNFKAINDKYGHAIGDKTLVRVAKALNKHFGNDVDSFIFRLGGDEFAILIENYSNENDDVLLKKLELLNDELSKNDKDLPGISLSIGVAHGKSDDTTDTLFRKADQALYQVKKQGRHGVAIAK